MSGGYEQIPEGFLRDLEAKRRRLVEAQEENDANLKALEDFLYPDTAHLVLELLQNAEDAGATSARFDLDNSKLCFIHDGRPFSKNDIDSITTYFKSEKYKKEDKIGRFGIGFKSVFACTETPRIYSDTVAFEIVDRIVPRPIPRPAALIERGQCKTVIELPFNGRMKAANDAREEIRSGLTRMSAMSILHLTSITSIHWRTYDGSSGQLSRTDSENGVVRVDKEGTASDARSWFLRFREPYAKRSSMHLDVVFELKERESAQESLWTDGKALADHFRIVPAKRGNVAVFFPAEKETSNLRFHLHAPFIPELSRASIKEHPDNDDLLERLAGLVATSLPRLRDWGLLDRDFLGVLPNSRDPLPKAYKPFHKTVVRKMCNEPFVPMHGGGHEAATRLVRGHATFKDWLGVSDINFLMSGWDAPPGSETFKWMRTPRSPGTTAPNYYRGWVVAATQRNSHIDRLLSDLRIDEFLIKYLAPATSKSKKDIKAWLQRHDVAWHREYYASLVNHWNALDSIGDRLCGLPMVRTRSGGYQRGNECRFADAGEDTPDGVAIADPDIYSAGEGSKEAKKGLERLGVREIDDQSKVNGILNQHYSGAGNRLSWDQHRTHMKYFIRLVRCGRIAPNTFQEYRVLLDSEGQRRSPGELFAGIEYPDANAAPYHRCLERLDTEERHRCPVQHRLNGRYRDIPGFGNFARRVGVAYAIRISPRPCKSNEMWDHLRSGGGTRVTDHNTDRDWQIPGLDAMLRRFERNAAEEHTVRVDLARSIHATLEECGNAWPPRNDIAPEGDAPGCLVAIYRMNTNADYRAAPSQLVFTLRDRAWVPQEDDETPLYFVKPIEMREKRLPKGFARGRGWAWVRKTAFEEKWRKERQISEKDKLAASAVALGFESMADVDEAKRFAKLPQEERKMFWKGREPRVRRFPPIRNPVIRRGRARAQARRAPIRRTVVGNRSVVEGEDGLKEDARTKLLASYDENASLSLCQVASCTDRSFRLDGRWYFEAVRFLSLNKMIAADYVALCPRHAAMYLYANQTDGLKERFPIIDEDALAHAAGVAIPVTLAGENLNIVLAPSHAVDLDEALRVERGLVGD